MILVVYAALKEVLKARKVDPVAFLHFFQIDDDLDRLTVFDKTTFSRVSCSLSVALQFLQRTLQRELADLDLRQSFIDDVMRLHGNELVAAIGVPLSFT